jgi:hypothetical protein
MKPLKLTPTGAHLPEGPHHEVARMAEAFTDEKRSTAVRSTRHTEAQPHRSNVL